MNRAALHFWHLQTRAVTFANDASGGVERMFQNLLERRLTHLLRFSRIGRA
jgi:hypothetical protein